MKYDTIKCDVCGKIVTPQKHNGHYEGFQLTAMKWSTRLNGTKITDRNNECIISVQNADACSIPCLMEAVKTATATSDATP